MSGAGLLIDPGRPLAPAWRDDDFPDWLSPMLVRELRQAVRSGVFRWGFLGVHLVMGLLMAYAVLHPQRVSGDAIGWGVLGLVLGVGLPLRGLAAIHDERQGNTFDLLRLTRLSATRIVFGKWLAIVVQCLLVATAVLPYFLLRYFFGGVDPLADLVRFLLLLLGSMLVTAMAVAASTRTTRERCGFIVGGVLFFSWAARGTFSSLFIGPAVTTSWLLVTLVMLVYLVLLLEYAAAEIAPATENHAFRKRLIALVVAIFVLGFGTLGSRQEFLVIAVGTLPAVVYLMADALTERPVWLRSVMRPFARRGAAGRMLAAILTPGWATAVVCLALVAAGYVGGWLAWTGRFAAASLPVAVALATNAVAAIVYPLPVLRLVPTRWKLLPIYTGVQMVCFFVFLFDGILRTLLPPGRVSSADETLLVVLPFPLAVMARVPLDGERHALLFTVSGFVVLVLVLALVSRPWSRDLRRTWRLVAEASAA